MGPEAETGDNKTKHEEKQQEGSLNLTTIVSTAKGLFAKVLPQNSLNKSTDTPSSSSDKTSSPSDAGSLTDSKQAVNSEEDSPYQFHGGKDLVKQQTRQLENDGKLPQTHLEGEKLAKAREVHEKETRRKIIEQHQLIPLEKGWGPYQALEKMHPDWSAKKTVAEAVRIRDLNLHGRTYFDQGEKLLTLSAAEIDQLVAAEMKKFDQGMTDSKQQSQEATPKKSETPDTETEVQKKAAERKQIEDKVRDTITAESKLIPLQPGWGPYQALEKMHPGWPKQKILEQALHIKELNGGGPFKINQELITHKPETIEQLVQEQMKLYDEQQAKLKAAASPDAPATANPAPSPEANPDAPATANPAPSPEAANPEAPATANPAPSPEANPDAPATANPAPSPEANPDAPATANPAPSPEAGQAPNLAQPTEKINRYEDTDNE